MPRPAAYIGLFFAVTKNVIVCDDRFGTYDFSPYMSDEKKINSSSVCSYSIA